MGISFGLHENVANKSVVAAYAYKYCSRLWTVSVGGLIRRIILLDNFWAQHFPWLTWFFFLFFFKLNFNNFPTCKQIILWLRQQFPHKKVPLQSGSKKSIKTYGPSAVAVGWPWNPRPHPPPSSKDQTVCYRGLNTRSVNICVTILCLFSCWFSICYLQLCFITFSSNKKSKHKKSIQFSHIDGGSDRMHYSDEAFVELSNAF